MKQLLILIPDEVYAIIQPSVLAYATTPDDPGIFRVAMELALAIVSSIEAGDAQKTLSLKHAISEAPRRKQ